MNFLNLDKKNMLLYTLAISVIFIAIYFFLFFFLIYLLNPQDKFLNKSGDIVYIENSVKENYIENFLEVNGYNYLSLNNIEIILEHYVKEKILLKNLSERFIPGDDRYTEFLKKLPEIFYYKSKSGREYTMFMIDGMNSNFIKNSIKFLNNKNSLITGKFVTNFQILYIIFSIFTFVVFFLYARPKKYDILWFFSFFILAMVSRNSVFIWINFVILILLSNMFYRLCEKFDDFIKVKKIEIPKEFYNEFIKKTIFVLLAVLIFGIFMGQNYLFYLFAFFEILLFFIFILLKFQIHRHKSRDSFYDLFSLKKLKDESKVKFSIKKDWPIFLVLIFPIFFIFSQKVQIDFPVPVKLEKKSYGTYSGLVKYFNERKDKKNLDFSDFLLEKIFQKYYKYEKIKKMPELNSQILITDYYFENNKINSEKKIINQFTESWYTSIIREIRDEPISKIFFIENIPTKFSDNIVYKNSKNKFGIAVLLSLLTLFFVLTEFKFKNLKGYFNGES